MKYYYYYRTINLYVEYPPIIAKATKQAMIDTNQV
jgi:hypothetical protein